MGTADWDIEDHSAAAGPFFQLGAIGAIPPGQGIVEGGEIPYKPAALRTKEQKLREPFEGRPGSEVLHAGRARARRICRIHSRSFNPTRTFCSPMNTPPPTG